MMPETSAYEEEKTTGNPTKKRTLSDAMNEKGSSQQTTTGTSDSSGQEPELTPREAQRRTDELIQKMLQEDQNLEAQYDEVEEG